MSEQYKIFKELLNEMFMFDRADLDFGIYRILNKKRKEIEEFLEKRMHDRVKDVLEKTRGQISERGQHWEFSELENNVYNHLSTFFSRYYDKGDFISRRRYNRHGSYAIPYNGEEVKLHWANADQYYVKSDKYFRNYAFKTNDGYTVNFELRDADTEVNNNKENDNEKRRFFVPNLDNVSSDEIITVINDKEITVYFVYQNYDESQKNLNGRVTSRIMKAISECLPEEVTAQWITRLSRSAAVDSQKTVLAKHVDTYTAVNSYDFFIHKNLGQFLRRELDFYVKNEIMNLDGIDEASSVTVDTFLLQVRAVRTVGLDIIGMLHQVEEFQRKLWLKKKFVVETNYLIAIKTIHPKYHAQILKNEMQMNEWRNYYAINPTQESLVNYPTLMIDTAYFDQTFTLKLLDTFEDIDENLDGLLIHSDNFQALTLLQHRYINSIECVHIDPPYNTQTSGFLYKNSYQHSSWMSMMSDRLSLATKFLNDLGSLLCHIDENEYERLHLLLESIGIPDAGTIVWDKRNPMNAGRGIARQHEYINWRSNNNSPLYLRNDLVLTILNKAKELVNSNLGVVNTAVQSAFAKWLDNNESLSGGEKAYRYIDKNGNVFQSVSLRAPEPRLDAKFHQPLIHPITGKPCPVPPNGFSRTPETLAQMKLRDEIVFGIDESTQPRQKMILTVNKQRQVPSLIQNAHKGKADLDALNLGFPYSHPVSLYTELMGAVCTENKSIALDFFAGSGTSGQAIIELNRKDGLRRSFILVEQGSQFIDILVPRMKKIAFSPHWKSGLVNKQATHQEIERSPKFIKYVRLESYEDTLNNLDVASNELARHIEAERPNDTLRADYMMSYMLTAETAESNVFLGGDTFERPFSQTLNVATQSVGQTNKIVVDLVETFNYLIGLRVATMRTYSDGNIRVITGTTNTDGKRVVVIWRDLGRIDDDSMWSELTEQKTVMYEINRADTVFLNGDSVGIHIQNPKKLRMIEGEFRTLMFDSRNVE